MMKPLQPNPNKMRSRRLRKKLHVGEFAEWGFSIQIELDPAILPDDEERLLDAFLFDLIEKNGLGYGGGTFYGFVCSDSYRRPVTPADRTLVATWLSSRREIVSFRVGELEDAWYGARSSERVIGQTLPPIGQRPKFHTFARSGLRNLQFTKPLMKTLHVWIQQIP
jgi:uncharacterized protein